MSKLTFAEFSRANEARKKQFFKGATVENWSISDAFMAAAGEMGEVAEALLYLAAMRHLGEAGNALKKVRRAELGMLNKNADDRQIDDLEQAKKKVAGEIGGFMCYLDQLCVQIGLRLEDCIVDEFNTKSKELDLPERIVDGKFSLATKGTFRFVGPGGVEREYEGELHQEVPEPNRTIRMKLDEDGDLYSELAAQIHRTKYRDTWPNTLKAFQAAYGEQPFNESGIVGPPRSLILPFISPERTFMPTNDHQVERVIVGPEIYNFDDPVVLQAGVTYELGVNHDGQPFCRPAKVQPKPDRPTVWTDGCGKCRWCAMEPDCNPYCTNPTVKAAAGATVGIGLNSALQTCTKEGKLSLFEPRK